MVIAPQAFDLEGTLFDMGAGLDLGGLDMDLFGSNSPLADGEAPLPFCGVVPFYPTLADQPFNPFDGVRVAFRMVLIAFYSTYLQRRTERFAAHTGTAPKFEMPADSAASSAADASFEIQSATSGIRGTPALSVLLCIYSSSEQLLHRMASCTWVSNRTVV